MISLDQVLLLEQKVESAVEKIKQLEGENDALRSKCSELTNALSAKTEQLAAFESEQKTIESGIIKAIDRLNSIENSVLKTAGQSEPSQAQEKTSGLAAAASKIAEESAPVTNMSFEQMTPVEEEIPEEEPVVEEEPPFEEVSIDEPIEDPIGEEPVEDPIEDPIEEPIDDPESKDNLGFDIF